VNIVQTRHKVFAILGEASASSPFGNYVSRPSRDRDIETETTSLARKATYSATKTVSREKWCFLMADAAKRRRRRQNWVEGAPPIIKP